MTYKGSAFAKLMAGGLILAIPAVGNAAGPRDSVYIHCSNEAGDFRISDLNRTVAKYSDRYGEYRPVCTGCNVTQWGDVITMDDGDNVSVWVDRLKGRVSIRRRLFGNDANTAENRPFSGACVRSQVMAAAPPTPRRAF